MELEPAPGEISSTKAFESAIYKIIDDEFVSDYADKDDYSLDSNLHHNLSMRSEISQMMGSIGSVTLDQQPCELFTSPMSGDFKELEQALMTVLCKEDMTKVAAQVHAVRASTAE